MELVIKKIVSGKNLIIESALALVGAISGFNFYVQVSAQSNEVKTGTAVLEKRNGEWENRPLAFACAAERPFADTFAEKLM